MKQYQLARQKAKEEEPKKALEVGSNDGGNPTTFNNKPLSRQSRGFSFT